MQHIFVSDHPALDFLGTRKWRRSEQVEELLGDPEMLDEWFVQGGLLTKAPLSAVEDVASARVLREAIYRLVAAVIREQQDGSGQEAHDRSEKDIAVVNRAAADTPVGLRLVDGQRVLSGTATQALSSVARAAIDLLTREDPAAIKECGRPECTRIYLDRSRGRRRTWCGMDECGNQMKAAAYRQRRKARTRRDARVLGSEL